MKTFSTKLIVCLSLFASQCLLAQAPLLPLLENNTVGWTKDCYTNNGICGQMYPDDYLTHDRIVGDTAIGQANFKVLKSTTRHSNGFCVNGTYTNTYYLSFANNTMLTYDVTKGRVDTMYQFHGTGVGDKVTLLPGILSTGIDTMEISTIDSLSFANKKIRIFTLTKSRTKLFYADGIGFYHSGVFSTNSCKMTTYWFEAGSSLLCYQKDGKAYELVPDRKNPLGIASINLSTKSCENPLGLDNNPGNEKEVFVKVNSQHRLETSLPASTVAIFNTVGSLMMLSKKSDEIDISTLGSGVYIANITLQDGRRMKRKFVLSN